jgi:hypothetical protein
MLLAAAVGAARPADVDDSQPNDATAVLVVGKSKQQRRANVTSVELDSSSTNVERRTFLDNLLRPFSLSVVVAFASLCSFIFTNQSDDGIEPSADVDAVEDGWLVDASVTSNLSRISDAAVRRNFSTVFEFVPMTTTSVMTMAVEAGNDTWVEDVGAGGDDHWAGYTWAQAAASPWVLSMLASLAIGFAGIIPAFFIPSVRQGRTPGTRGHYP